MPDFSKRSSNKELLDSPGIPFEDIRKNMQELESINHLLGGHKITINGLKKIITSASFSGSRLSICELGCGGGDNLAAICKWAKRNNISISCTGIDINHDCIRYAKDKNKGLPINFIAADYREGLNQINRSDIIFSALFCHHFPDNELVEMLGHMRSNSSLGFFINDLQRHPFAYYSIKALTTIFSKSYLVKNDAPQSVLRGFRSHEWKHILHLANISNATITWQWAFRYLVTFNHQKP